MDCFISIIRAGFSEKEAFGPLLASEGQKQTFLQEETAGTKTPW